MCMAIYLTSDVPLPLIRWHEDTPGFNVVELIDNEKVVRAQFSKQYIYYIGAHTGCSCGFTASPDENPETALNSRKAFQTYIKNALNHGTLELFICWEGDWEKEPSQRLSLSPEDIIDADRWHHELTYVKISK